MTHPATPRWRRCSWPTRSRTRRARLPKTGDVVSRMSAGARPVTRHGGLAPAQTLRRLQVECRRASRGGRKLRLHRIPEVHATSPQAAVTTPTGAMVHPGSVWRGELRDRVVSTIEALESRNFCGIDCGMRRLGRFTRADRAILAREMARGLSAHPGTRMTVPDDALDSAAFMLVPTEGGRLWRCRPRRVGVGLAS